MAGCFSLMATGLLKLKRYDYTLKSNDRHDIGRVGHGKFESSDEIGGRCLSSSAASHGFVYSSFSRSSSDIFAL
jgi:hypothetical protein